MNKKLILVTLAIVIVLAILVPVLLANYSGHNIKNESATVVLPNLLGVEKTEVQTNTKTILAEAQKQDIINALKPELDGYVDTKIDALRTELKRYADQGFNNAKTFATNLVGNNVQRNTLNCQVVQPGAGGQNTGDAICARLNGQLAINNWACAGTIKHDRFNTFSDASCYTIKNSSDVTDLYSCSQQQLSITETACESIGHSTWRKIKSNDAAICCSVL